MNHQHTLTKFDCRPMKAACHHTIDRCARGELSAIEASEELGAYAASLPDLTPSKFQHHMAKLLAFGNYDRAHSLVDKLGDFTLRAWVPVTVRLVWWLIKLGLFAAFIVLIVRLAK